MTVLVITRQVFDMDVQRLASATDAWKDRTPPKPLKWSTLNKNLKKTKLAAGLDRDHQQWTTQQAFKVFVESFAFIRTC
jgi:hypothetical protein